MRIVDLELPHTICFECDGETDVEYYLEPTTSFPYPHYIETCRRCGSQAGGALSDSRAWALRAARRDRDSEETNTPCFSGRIA